MFNQTNSVQIKELNVKENKTKIGRNISEFQMGKQILAL